MGGSTPRRSGRARRACPRAVGHRRRPWASRRAARQPRSRLRWRCGEGVRMSTGERYRADPGPRDGVQWVAEADGAGHPVFDDVALAGEAMRRGLPVIVTDDADRENEGDVILAAVHATPEWIGWTVRHTSGMLCAPMPEDVADRLALPPM